MQGLFCNKKWGEAVEHIAKRAGRLSSFLREEMELSAGLMNKLKWQQRLLVNGVPCFTNHPVNPGDVITVLLPEAEPEYPAENGELRVLYEDDHILAVDKPAGILIHPSRACNTGTLANFVLGYYNETGQSCAFHPVTRLDRDTFGVVLLAKNPHIHARFQKLPLQKTYLARVFGAPPELEGEINAPIARRELPSLLRYVDPSGKESITRYRLLETDGKTSLLELTPITGRTHQLRVHCAYMGCPILGDPQYASCGSREFSQSLNLKSQLLCAARVTFQHPVAKETVTIHSKQSPN